MTNDKKEVTIAVWADLVGVSRQRAHKWAKEGRIKVRRPASRVTLISPDHPRPAKVLPYGLVKQIRIAHR